MSKITKAQQAGRTARRERIVIKIGTNSLTKSGRVALGVVASLVETCTALHRMGFSVVVVSSGSVGVGCQTMRREEKPTDLPTRQALAAVGQIRLMRTYEDMFTAVNTHCAQVLLTFENLGQQLQHRNAKNTFEALFKMNVVPIVNENDTVAVQELRFGDNDRLSAMIAALVEASWLFLLTDVDGVFTANPKVNPDATVIPVVRNICEIGGVSVDPSAGSEFSTGGMGTKISAAQLATAAGAKTVIMSAQDPQRVLAAIRGDQVGTLFLPNDNAVRGQTKRWIMGLNSEGTIYVNEGASRAITRKKSLFAAGVMGVEGIFREQACVSICTAKDSSGIRKDGREAGEEKSVGANVTTASGNTSPGPESRVIAKALINYASDDVAKIKGLQSQDIAAVLGYANSEEVAHRSNIVLLDI